MTRDAEIELVKIIKKSLEEDLERLKSLPITPNRTDSITNIERAITWMRIDLRYLTE